MARKARDWNEEELQYFQDEAIANVYGNLPTVPDLPEDIDERARELFIQAWATFDTYSPEQIEQMRQDFFDLIGIQESQFEWFEYKELYLEVAG